MSFPEDTNEQKLIEVGLALLWLGAHSDRGITRAWKGLDWELLNLLHEKGLISNPVGKAKSVVLSQEALELAEKYYAAHFQSPKES